MKHHSNLQRRQFLTRTGAACAGMLAFPHVAKPAAKERIKIGQIGTRHAHAVGKLQTIRQLNEIYELVGVVEPDLKRRSEAEQTNAFKGVRWLAEEELLNTPGLKAVAVETEVEELASTALRCIRAGLHIHLDKPGGTSLSTCRELHAEANQRGLTIQMGYMFRYNPGFAFAFRALREGWLGQISELGGMIGKKADPEMRLHLSRFAGGGMFELGCHLIDCMVTVLGKPTKVTAVSQRTQPNNDAFADNQLAVFEYPNVIATIRCNHLDPLGFARREFRVTGDNGTVEIGPLEPPKVRLGLAAPRGGFNQGYQPVEMKRAAGRYDGEFVDLAAVIRGEKKLAWDSEHDLVVMELVLRGSGMPAA